MVKFIWIVFIGCLFYISSWQSAIVFASESGYDRARLEKKLFELDEENVALLNDQGQRKKEQEALILKVMDLQDKLGKSNDLNVLHQRLKEQAQEIARERQKIEVLSVQLEARHRSAISKAQSIIDQKASVLVQAYRNQRMLEATVKNLESERMLVKTDNEQLIRVNARLEQKGKRFFLKANEFEAKSRSYDNLALAAGRLGREVSVLKTENNALKNQLELMKRNINMERASIYRESGAAYTQAGLVEEAIRAYKVSLNLDSEDPMTYYYLGLLYAKKWKDADAVFNFKKYLTLVPLAENREDVERFMANLIGRSDVAIK